MSPTRLSQVAGLLLFTIVGCPGSKEEAQEPKPRPNGSFKITFGKPSSAEDQNALNLIKDKVEKVVGALNARVALPSDIPIVFSSNSDNGPAYSPSALTGISVEGIKGRLIVYPYSFVKLTKDVLSKTSFPPKELNDAVIATTAFSLTHEASHALIHVLDLPVLGREEDAADSGAAIFLGSLPEEADIVHDTITFWRNFGELRGVQHNSFADSHGLDLQRAYNLACWTYGKNLFDNKVLKHELPATRALGCPAEYSKLANSWDKVLKGYIKEQF